VSFKVFRSILSSQTSSFVSGSLPRIVLGEYLKLAFEAHERHGTLDVGGYVVSSPSGGV
jgi:hypothetical protein